MRPFANDKLLMATELDARRGHPNGGGEAECPTTNQARFDHLEDTRTRDIGGVFGVGLDAKFAAEV